jgi:hypothetical protein
MLRELCPARFHFDKHATRPNKVGKLGAVAGKTDAILEGRTFRERIGVVPEGFQQMEEKRLCLAFFVAFELGGERGEIVESAFLRGHPEPECAPKICQRQLMKRRAGLTARVLKQGLEELGIKTFEQM